MSGQFDAEKNKFIIEINEKEQKELSHKELENLLEDKVQEINVIYKLLAKHPQLIKE